MRGQFARATNGQSKRSDPTGNATASDGLNVIPVVAASGNLKECVCSMVAADA